MDTRVDVDRIVPGEEVAARVIVWNGGPSRVAVEEVGVDLPSGWTRPATASPATLGPGELREWRFTFRVPETAEPSRPYFLVEPREGALYHWPTDAQLMGRPGNAPLIVGRVSMSVDGGPTVTTSRPGSHVVVDQADGEYRVPVFVLPAVSVEVDPRTSAWPLAETRARSVSVRITALGREGAEGELRLIAPQGWEVVPETRSVSLPSGGEQMSYAFDVRPDPGRGSGRAILRAVLTSEGNEYDEGVDLIDYPHVDPVPLFRPAQLAVSQFAVAVPTGLRVGYITGPGDSGAQALTDVGVEVELLGPEEVRSGDLDRYDTIVLGIRAYETREDLRSSNERLLEFARRGGTVIVQYNQYQYPAGGFAPLPVEIARPHDRITNPQAEVTLLEPDHPALTSPNRLSAEDFEGWVQERGLYFLSRWDDGYMPLLEMADPGEDPKRGSLLVTQLGEGAYVYTGLALFRQFPAGVPGAFRILVNLVSLRGADLAPVL